MSDTEQQVKSLKVTAPIISYLNNGNYKFNIRVKINPLAKIIAEELPPRKLNKSCIIGDENFSKFEQQLISSNTESGNGFVTVVSLHDAITLYVSSGITSTLGYPQDMLVGQVCYIAIALKQKLNPFSFHLVRSQSIMGFLYPKDRLTFANLLSRGLQSRFCHANESPIDSDGRFVFHTRIREYKGLKNCGFDIVGKKPTCKPFQLRCFVRDVASAERMGTQEEPSDHESQEQSRHDLLTMCFVIVAIPMKSAHKRKYLIFVPLILFSQIIGCINSPVSFRGKKSSYGSVFDSTQFNLSLFVRRSFKHSLLRILSSRYNWIFDL